MPETVTVIAGGWSAGSVKNPPIGEGFVIGVNDAARYAKVHLALTMDRLWLEHRWEELTSKGVPILAREAAARNVPARAEIKLFLNDHTSFQMSESQGVLNGTNSGLCALNYAYQLRPARIVMIGFDMRRHPVTGAAYWYPPYSWSPQGGTKPGKYREWAQQFGPFADACAKAGIIVSNRSGASAIPILERA